MVNFFKNNTICVYWILLVIVFLGKISNWFLNYSDDTNKLFNTAMFCMIGIAYLAYSWAYDKLILKIIFAACGIYVIVMNIIPESNWNSIIGIICILTPMIIRRILPDENEEKEMSVE